jgi:hypothetical protein
MARGIYVDSDGNRFSRRTGMLIRPRRSRGYHERKSDWYRRVGKDAKALGRKIVSKLSNVLGREHAQKAKRAAMHGRKR